MSLLGVLATQSPLSMTSLLASAVASARTFVFLPCKVAHCHTVIGLIIEGLIFIAGKTWNKLLMCLF